MGRTSVGKLDGKVIIVTGRGEKENALRAPSGITYAIPAKYIQALLDKAGLQSQPMHGK